MCSKFAVILALASLLVFATGCSSKPPSVRIMNEGPTKANMQIKAQSGNTININDVAGGTATNYQDINTGPQLVTAVIQTESVSPSVSFNADEDNNYTIIVVNSTPPTLRVDASGK
jgi:hypothetical protein